MNITGAIFDMDGTLLDSMPMWDNVGQNYLRSLGIEPRKDLREILRPLSLRQAAEYMREAYSLALTTEQIMEGIDQSIEQRYFTDLPLKPGVKEMLERLHRQGVPMCIATATDRYLVEAALRRVGILDYFGFILTCSEAGFGKDRPDIYEMARERLGTDKATTCVFEDALYAVQTAKQAGFPVVGVYDASASKAIERIRTLCDRFVVSFEKEDLFLD